MSNFSFMKQLDEFYDSKMIGLPVEMPKNAILRPDMTVLRTVWQNYLKVTGEMKTRLCGNGSPKAVPGLRDHANTHSSAIHPTMLKFHFATGASRNHYFFSRDVKNAYAAAPGPTIPTFLIVDDAIADWLARRFGIYNAKGMMIPCYKALQGHPEAGALFENWINERFFIGKN